MTGDVSKTSLLTAGASTRRSLHATGYCKDDNRLCWYSEYQDCFIYVWRIWIKASKSIEWTLMFIILAFKIIVNPCIIWVIFLTIIFALFRHLPSRSFKYIRMDRLLLLGFFLYLHPSFFFIHAQGYLRESRSRP